MNKLLVPGILFAILLGTGIWYVMQKPSIKDFELDKEKQQLIWDSEHITFEIETYFGKPLAKALKAGDDEKIRSLVADRFVAHVIPLSASVKKKVKTFDQEKWVADGNLETGDVETLITFFRSRMQNFASVERAKTRVLHIYPVEGDSHAWKTELLITVHGVAESGNPLKISSHHEVKFRYEDDEEIHEGGTALEWHAKDITLTESLKPFFKEVSTETGLTSFDIPDNWHLPVKEAAQLTFQIAVEDFDRDGDYDIAVATYKGIPYLLCNQNGKFEDRSRELGLNTWEPEGPFKSSLAGWADIDNDGYVDLLLGNSIYRNINGLRFKDITEESGIVFGHDPRSVTVADYDCDGLVDLYFSRSHEFQQAVDRPGWVGDNEAGAPNALWKNMGKGKFKNVTAEANAGGGNRTTFTSSWFYMDDDRYPDLYIANDFSINVVLRNKGDGTFEDASFSSGAADFATSMGVATGDINNDGTTEIYVANMYSKMGRRIISHVNDDDYPEDIFPQIQGSCAGNRLYQIGSDGKYSDVTDIAGVNEVGWAFAPLLYDFDGDGLLDIYATTGFMSFNREKPDG